MTTRFVLIGIGLGLVLSLAASIGCEDQAAKTQDWFGSHQKASNDTTPAFPTNPKIPPKTHYAAGRLLERRGDFEGAISQYRRAIAMNADYVDAWNRLGATLDRVGQFNEADAAFTEAIIIQPDEAYLRNNLAFSYMLQRRWADAEAELRNALLLDPQFTRAQVNLGLVLAKQQRYDEAQRTFLGALPETDAHYNMGLIYREQGLGAQAKASFSRALALDPQFEAAQTQLAAMQERDATVLVAPPTTRDRGTSAPAPTISRVASATVSPTETVRTPAPKPRLEPTPAPTASVRPVELVDRTPAPAPVTGPSRSIYNQPPKRIERRTETQTAAASPRRERVERKPAVTVTESPAKTPQPAAVNKPTETPRRLTRETRPERNESKPGTESIQAVPLVEMQDRADATPAAEPRTTASDEKVSLVSFVETVRRTASDYSERLTSKSATVDEDEQDADCPDTETIEATPSNRRIERAAMPFLCPKKVIGNDERSTTTKVDESPADSQSAEGRSIYDPMPSHVEVKETSKARVAAATAVAPQAEKLRAVEVVEVFSGERKPAPAEKSAARVTPASKQTRTEPTVHVQTVAVQPVEVRETAKPAPAKQESTPRRETKSEAASKETINFESVKN